MNLADKLKNIDSFIDNEFFSLYCSLIENNLLTSCKRGITQRHHIIPRYYFKRLNLPVDNSKENLVNLQYKDHILAHYYLSLCSRYTEDQYANLVFLNYSLRGTNEHFRVILEEDLSLLEDLQNEYLRVNRLKFQERHERYVQKQEEKLKKWISEGHHCLRCGKLMTEKYGTGKYCCKSCAVTHNHTEETKQLLRRMNYENVCGRRGMKTSDETKQLKSEIMKKYYSEHKYVYMTKDGVDVRVSPDMIDHYTDMGYIRGQSHLKGRVAWNKGLTKNDSRVKKNIDRRNETMLERYGTLDGNIFKNRDKE